MSQCGEINSNTPVDLICHVVSVAASVVSSSKGAAHHCCPAVPVPMHVEITVIAAPQHHGLLHYSF